ncbi:MAG: PEP-CTERM sorting domain-containing protein [Phycisphaerae bacterium]|nr:PEP-CTERM sorting domain-containing protein [Phycisphaerae bacterium]
MLKSTYIALVTMVISLAGVASATMYEGSLSYGDGLFATQQWADPNTFISWTITNEDLEAPAGFDWKYTYTLSVPKKDISHILLEASNGEHPFTAANLADVTGTDAYEVDTFTPGKSNPLLPADLYGVKFDDLSDTDLVISFYSDRAPVWGDFYAKDGKNKGKDVVMYNTGFTDPDPIDPPSDGSNAGHLLRPDTTPEPSLLVLLSLGGAGLLRRRHTFL